MPMPKLLRAGVSAQGGHFGSALQAALEGGHEAIVELLLEKGAGTEVGRFLEDTTDCSYFLD